MISLYKDNYWELVVERSKRVVLVTPSKTYLYRNKLSALVKVWELYTTALEDWKFCGDLVMSRGEVTYSFPSSEAAIIFFESQKHFHNYFWCYQDGIGVGRYDRQENIIDFVPAKVSLVKGQATFSSNRIGNLILTHWSDFDSLDFSEKNTYCSHILVWFQGLVVRCRCPHSPFLATADMVAKKFEENYFMTWKEHEDKTWDFLSTLTWKDFTPQQQKLIRRHMNNPRKAEQEVTKILRDKFYDHCQDSGFYDPILPEFLNHLRCEES